MNEREIFVAALEQHSIASRQAYVAEMCGTNADLQQRVEALLRAHNHVGSFLNSAALAGDVAATLDLPSIAERPGSVIGPYKLLEQIGEGGMGVVFMAEQMQPIQRKVALKIIKPGMDTKQVIARFEAERQALALMDHPNIARVLDAGSTETGRPYFVMELVRGVPVTEYSDSHRLSIRERLELFITVCQAVQHAHQKGIIHRDLKPTNVLVTLHDGRPVVKVIDFGIAKATGQKLTEKTLFTGFAQMVGTPLYMAPEQAEMSGLDVDTRSDIYSLGVLLYELLTGSTPFDSQRLKEAAFDELRRILREEDPPRPSARLSTLAQQAISTVSDKRASDPRQLSRLFQGELDWIVMKTLEKDRNRRYETASALAADVEHYLHDEPVQACPPSAMYRIRKFARRNQAALFTASLVLAALVLGITVSTWQAIRAHRAEQQALDNVKRANAISTFLVDALNSSNPENDSNTIGTSTIPDLLDRAVSELDGGFADDPLTKAALLLAIGDSYYGLGLYDKQIPLLEMARDLRVHALGEDHPDTLYAKNALAIAYWSGDRLKEALPLVEDVVKRRTAALGPDHPDTLRPTIIVAIAYANSGRLEDARKLFEQTLKHQRATLGSEHIDTIRSMCRLAEFFSGTGRVDEARVLYEEAVRSGKSEMAGSSFYRGFALSHLAILYDRAGRLDDALPLYEEALQHNKTKFGSLHRNTLFAAYNLALAYRRTGRMDDATRLFDEAVKSSQKAAVLNPESDLVWQIMGWAQYRSGAWKASIESLEKSCALQKKLDGGDPGQWFILAMAHYQLGNKEEARNWYDRAAEWRKKNQPDDEGLRRWHSEASELLQLPGPEPTTRDNQSENPNPDS